MRSHFKEKAYNVLKFIFKSTLHLIGWIVVFVLLSLIEDEDTLIFLSNAAGVSLVIIYIFPIMNRTYLKEKTARSESFPDLYVWVNNLIGVEYLLEKHLKKYKSESLMENLKRIKYNIVTKLTNGSLNELRLLKAYFQAYKSSKLEYVYYKTIATSILTILIFVTRSLIINKDNKAGANTDIGMFFQIQNSWGMYLGLFIVLIYFLLIPHKHENRINLVNNIIEECIEEQKDELDKK